MQTPISYFTALTDPRVDRTKDHLMEDIIFITIVAVMCGAETRNEQLKKRSVKGKRLDAGWNME